MNARRNRDLNEQLLEQLQIADKVILNALAEMTSDQKQRWNRANVRAGIHFEDGLVGMSARQDVIKQALQADWKATP